MSKRPATIIDVARRAGVSRTTASDALRGHGRVAEATRFAVAAAAEALGYRANTAARSLRSATTGTLGIHLPEVLTRIEYYMQAVYGALERAAPAEVDVMLITSRRVAAGRPTPSVDGVILLDQFENDPVVERLLSLELPVVIFDGAPTIVADTVSGSTAVVTVDHEAAVGTLLDHVARAGAGLPAFLASPAVTHWGARVQAIYRSWCAERSLAPIVVERPFGSDSATSASVIRALLERRPDVDAVICGPYDSAPVVLDVLRDLGRALPVAALVDSPALALTDPAVTAIDLAPRTAGAACVDLLLDIVRGDAAPDSAVPFPIEVHHRESTLAGP